MSDRLKIILSLIITLGACAGPYYSSFTSVANSDEDELQKIVFINLQFTKNENSEIQVKYLGSEIKNGYVKNDTTDFNKTVDDIIKCSFLDINKKPVKIIGISNPLHRKYEYFREDGSPAYKETDLDSTPVMIRTNYIKKMEYLSIEQIKKGMNQKHLITIRL